jgi:hypothetical protein
MVQEEQPDMTEAKPPRRVLRLVLLSLLIAVLALVATPFIYVSNAGGLAGLMQTELSRRLGGAQVVVGDASVEFQLPSFQLTVRADNVDLALEGGSLTVPRSSVVLTPRALLTWAPSDIVLGGLDLDLTLDPESWHKSPLGVVAATIAAPASAGEDDTLPGRQITIASASLTLRDPAGQARPVRFENVESEFAAAADGTFVGLIKGDRFEGGVPAGNLSVSAIGDLTQKDFRVDVTMDELATSGLATMSPFLPTVLADAGRMSGSASLSITSGVLDAADMDIVAVEGSLDLADVGFPELAYDTGSVVITYNHKDGALSLAQGELALTDGRRIALSGDFRDLRTDLPQLALRFRGNRWPIERIYEDWPERVAPEFRAALMQRASGGRLENFELEVSGGFQRSEATLQIVQLDLKSAVRGVLVDVGAQQYEKLTGIADGAVALRLGARGVVEALVLSVGVSDGSLKIVGHDAALPLSRAQVSATLQGNQLLLEDVSLVLADGGSIGVGGALSLSNGWGISGTDLKIVANAMDIGRFHAIWPEWLVSKTRSWVGQKMLQGRVEDIRLEVASGFTDGRPQITRLEGTVTMRDAHLQLSPKLPVFTNIDGRLTIADNRGEIILTEGQVEGLKLATGKVEIAPVVGGNPAMGRTDLRLAGDVGEVIRVASRLGFAGSGMKLNDIEAIGKSELTLRTSFPVRRKLTPQDIQFDVEGTVSDATFVNLPQGAEAREAQLSFAADRSQFLIRGDATLFGLPSKVAYQRGGAAGKGWATLDVSTIDSSLAQLKQAALAIGYGGEGIDLAALTMSGRANVELRARFPTGRTPQRSDVEIETDIIVQDGNFDGLPLVGTARDADLVMHLSSAKTEISGSATLFGAPVDFVVTDDRDRDLLQVKADAPNAAGIATLASRLSGLQIGGALGGHIELATGRDRADFEVELALDLAEASIDVPALAWVKLPAEAGRVTTRLILRDGRLVSIEDIDLIAGSLEAVGRIDFGQRDDGSYGLAKAVFERLTWPGNDITTMTLSRDGGENWVIEAEAAQIDLVPLRRNRGIGEGRPVSFDILADQIFVGDGIALSGHLSGNKTGGGGGKAAFSGNLTYNKTPLINESELQLSYGKGGDFVNGVGVIGGAETTLTYTALDGKIPELTLASENGGGTLKGLRVTDAIRSGEMFLETRFIDGYENFDTTIRITNFSVVEAPAAIRAFSVLAPIGLYNLVEGEGTGFGWGEAVIEKRGSEVILRQVTGRGQAVSVAFVGKYDRSTRIMDVSGNLVPASFLSQIVGVIPLVGEILTGVDKSGLFVTQFSLEGDVDDPDASVTPASIVPGVLRDLFSPSWIRREGDRILGPQTDSSADSPAGD